MIAATTLNPQPVLPRLSLEGLVLRWLAVLVWRTTEAQARKLSDFAVTEAGSSLDMLRAAEEVDDPRLCRLFLRHAMDEARHARLFREAARRLGGAEGSVVSGEGTRRLPRENVFERFGLLRFIAFVYVAERRGEVQFRALGWHFRRHPDLGPLFTRIAHDERFHVAYSKKLLREWSEREGGVAVRRALLHVRAARAWEAWRRSGRGLGEGVSRLILGFVYAVLLPPFAALARRLDPDRPGWKVAKLPGSVGAARRQY